MESINAIAAQNNAADVLPCAHWRRESGGIKSLLGLPLGYRALHAVFGTSRMRRYYVDRFVRPKPASRIIDIGCGTADILNYLPEVEYIGVDCNPRYIHHNRRKFSRAQFQVARVSIKLMNLLPPADLVFANALLHHLDDVEVQTLFAVAKQLIVDGGRVCTLDNHIFPGQNPLSRFLIANDRGKYVRTRAEYERLAAPHFRDVRCQTSARLLNIPYDIVMFEFRNPIL